MRVIKVLYPQKVPHLVDLLRNGTIRGKKYYALTTLFNLSINHANKGRAVRASIVTPLLQLVKDTNLGMIDEALSILLLKFRSKTRDWRA